MSGAYTWLGRLSSGVKVSAVTSKRFGKTGRVDTWPELWLHPVDVVVIHELFEVLQVFPPIEEEGLCDEAEPGRDLQLLALGLVQHLLQLLLAHVTVAFDLIGVWTQLHVLQGNIYKQTLLLSIIWTDSGKR